MRKACFLDRDGVLIEEENYLSDPEKVRLCHGAAEAIRALRAAGYAIVVVSNQAGVARGYFKIESIASVEAAIAALLAKEGVSVDAWHYCPHHPKGKIPEYSIDCDCRKPAPGMLLKAAKEMGLDLSASMMIGDKLSDVEAAFNAGCQKAALVRTGHGLEQDLSSPLAARSILTDDILDAAKKLLAAK